MSSSTNTFRNEPVENFLSFDVQFNEGKRAWICIFFSFFFSILLFLMLPLLSSFDKKKTSAQQKIQIRPEKIIRPPVVISKPVSTPSIKKNEATVPKFPRLNLKPMQIKYSQPETIQIQFQPTKSMSYNVDIPLSLADTPASDQITPNIKPHFDAPFFALNGTPAYPPLAEAKQIEGHVEVECVIDTLGKVDQIIIIKSFPGPVFVNTTKRWLKKSKFEIRKSNGHAVQYKIRKKIVFKIE